MNISALQSAFEKKEYQFRYFAQAADSASYLKQAIEGKTIGFGDSHTLYNMGLFELILTHNDVRSPMQLLSVNGHGNRISCSLYGHEKVYFIFDINKSCLP